MQHKFIYALQSFGITKKRLVGDAFPESLDESASRVVIDESGE